MGAQYDINENTYTELTTYWYVLSIYININLSFTTLLGSDIISTLQLRKLLGEVR